LCGIGTSLPRGSPARRKNGDGIAPAGGDHHRHEIADPPHCRALPRHRGSRASAPRTCAATYRNSRLDRRATHAAGVGRNWKQFGLPQLDEMPQASEQPGQGEKDQGMQCRNHPHPGSVEVRLGTARGRNAADLPGQGLWGMH